jgi:hypothetical protein
MKEDNPSAAPQEFVCNASPLMSILNRLLQKRSCEPALGTQKIAPDVMSCRFQGSLVCHDSVPPKKLGHWTYLATPHRGGRKLNLHKAALQNTADMADTSG